MRSIASILLLAFLAACTTPDEREIAECRELGFTEGTEAFADCRLKVRQIRESRLGNWMLWRLGR